jgi:ubiquitin C
MRVSAAPDVVARIFRGVARGDLDLWSRATAEETVPRSGVVGIDSVRASDGSLFRVLEWGGMEVK